MSVPCALVLQLASYSAASSDTLHVVAHVFHTSPEFPGLSSIIVSHGPSQKSQPPCAHRHKVALKLLETARNIQKKLNKDIKIYRKTTKNINIKKNKISFVLSVPGCLWRWTSGWTKWKSTRTCSPAALLISWTRQAKQNRSAGAHYCSTCQLSDTLPHRTELMQEQVMLHLHVTACKLCSHMEQ